MYDTQLKSINPAVSQYDLTQVYIVGQGHSGFSQAIYGCFGSRKSIWALRKLHHFEVPHRIVWEAMHL